MDDGLNQEKRILNAGCGRDFSIGTDFVDLYPHDPKVKQCDLDSDRLPFEDSAFDEVYSKCVFEHLTNPSNLMKEAQRVLKPGGKLTVITDNATFIGWWVTSHKYDLCYGKEDSHYALFTASHLENWARKFGFTVEKIEHQAFFAENSSFPKNLFKRMASIFLPGRIGCTRVMMVARRK